MILIRLREFPEGFLDSNLVVRRMQKASNFALKRFGSFVRRTMKSSIKKAPRSKKKAKVSAPGSPPLGHGPKGGPLKGLILFDVNESFSVIIGPKKMPAVSPTAVRALEKGGKTLVMANKKKKVVATIKARPFMQPAFEKELPKAAGFWENRFRK